MINLFIISRILRPTRMIELCGMSSRIDAAPSITFRRFDPAASFFCEKRSITFGYQEKVMNKHFQQQNSKLFLIRRLHMFQQ
jgi:hypothetical protein